MSTAVGVPGEQKAAALARTSRLARIVRRLGDLLVPPACAACREPIADHDALCPDCWRQIRFIRPPLCDRLGRPLPYDTGAVTVSAAALAAPPAYDRARAVACYEGVMRRLVHELKYGDQHHARRLFGRWLRLAAADLLPGTDLILPVPLQRWRLWRRRFNQSAILADALSRATGIPADPLALVRTRATTSQVGLGAAERRRNVEGAFAVRRLRLSAVAGRNLLLVDDVITTGATVDAIARTLRRAGAARVDVVALAMVTDEPGSGAPV